MAGQHFARNLRVAWLVCSDQSYNLKSQDEQEAAERDKGQGVGGTANAI